MSSLSSYRSIRVSGVLVLLAFSLPAAAAAGPQANGLEPALRKALLEQAAQAGWHRPQVEFRVVTALPPGVDCPRPAVEPVDIRHPSRLRFAVNCPGSAGGRQEIIVRAEISAEVVVAAAALPAGHRLAAEDLAPERRDVSNSPDAVSDPSVAVGQALKRSLRPGQVLLRQMLAAPLLVRRGETVRIVARSGPVEVSNNGEAMENGHGDDIIRVRNSATGRMLRVRVIDRGNVEPVDLSIAPMPQFPD